jgi:hypothetical protein
MEQVDFNKNETSLINEPLFDMLSEITLLCIELCGIIANLINIIMFSNKQFKDNIFKYLFVYSISEFLYLFCIIIVHYRYFDKKSLTSVMIQLILEDYLTSSLAIFSIFIEITISIQRYLIISNSRKLKIIKNGSPYVMQIVLLFVALVYYLPDLILNKVVNDDDPKDNSKYSLEKTSNYKYYSLIVNTFRGPVCLTILIILNLISIRKFRNQMKIKSALRRKKSEQTFVKFLLFFLLKITQKFFNF